MSPYRSVRPGPGWLLALVLTCLCCVPDVRGEQAPSVEELRAELDRLRAEYEERVRRLEEAIVRLEQRPPTPPPPAPPPVPAVSPRAGNMSNPAISVIGDLVASFEDAEGDRDVDLSLSEVELGVQAVVDPYVRFDVFAAFHEHRDEAPLGLPASPGADEHGDEAEHEGGGLEVELEEAFVTTLGLPGGLQLRAGRLRHEVGRHNTVHLPEDAWADQPTVSRLMFGDEQLIDEAVELSWLVPTPFYWKITGAVSRGPSESPTFARAEGDDFLHVAHLEWFWDLSDTWSLEVGQSWARGPADHLGAEHAEVLGADVTLKWVPSRRRGFTWQTEVFRRRLPLALDHAHEGEAESGAEHDVVHELLEDWGAYTWLEWRFAQRWFAGLRLDHVDYDDELFEEEGLVVDDRWDASAVLAFWPSEFQTLRFQYRRTWDDLLAEPDHAFFVNWTWIMGAHGAHPF